MSPQQDHCTHWEPFSQKEKMGVEFIAPKRGQASIKQSVYEIVEYETT